MLRRWSAAAPSSLVTLMDLTANPELVDLANIDVDPAGNIYVCDRGLHRVYRVPPNANAITNPVTVAGNGDQDLFTGGNVLGREGLAATAVPMGEVRGIAFHPQGGYFLACHKGGDIWYVDAGGLVHVVLQGGQSGTTRLGDGAPVTVDRATLKIAEPRSVRFGWNGDLIICTNDAGFVRVVRSICPRTTLAAGIAPGGVVSWPGTASMGYFVERSGLLEAGDWATLHRRTVTVSGAQLFQDAAAPGLRRAFYRVHGHRAWPW
jgi:hypothetical protein